MRVSNLKFHLNSTINKWIKKYDEIKRVNQVWVSDITYIRTVSGFAYLALITDVYSRKIVGFDVSDSLELVGDLRALQKALRRSSHIAGIITQTEVFNIAVINT